MAFHSDPVGTGGAGTGGRLVPTPMRRGDDLIIDSGGYAFGFSGGARNHYVAVIPFTQPTGPTPLNSNVTMTWAAGDQYTISTAVGRFFDSVQMIVNGGAPGAAPATSIFKASGAIERLRIESTLFPTEGAYYLVGVGLNLNAPAGPLSIGKLIDWRIVFVQPRSLALFTDDAAGIDTTTLEIALGLAGHNIKMRNPAFINGLVARRDLALFGRALHAGTTPELEDVADDTGLGAPVLRVVSTPDAASNTAVDMTTEL